MYVDSIFSAVIRRLILYIYIYTLGEEGMPAFELDYLAEFDGKV